MKKTYIKPNTKVFNINIHDAILVDASQMGGGKLEDETNFDKKGSVGGGGTGEGTDFGRSNSTNIWSEEW